MKEGDIFEAMAEGAISADTQMVLPHGDWSAGHIASDFCVSRVELMRTCICGPDPIRTITAMEMILRLTEAGERFLILDLQGQFTSLIDYIPPLRVYKLGKYASMNPFAPRGDYDEFAKVISAAVQDLYGLERDERVFMEKALSASYADGIAVPTIDDLGDKLLQIEAESNPREGYKIESLRNILWELQMGAMGRMFAKRFTIIPKMPAIFDTSEVRTVRGKALLAMYAILCAQSWHPTSIIIDPADWVLRVEHSISPELSMIIESRLDLLSGAGIALHISTVNPASLPRWLYESLTARIMCGSLWERDLAAVERTFILGNAERKAIRRLQRGEALACIPGLDSPRILRPRPSRFRHVDDAEVIAHMRAMGEEAEELQQVMGGHRLLEKLFRDRGTLLYALELIKLVKGGRVPVDAVAKQRNVAMRHIVRALVKYFLIVEYADNSGVNWYRLTKAGERALAEIEDRVVEEHESETNV